MATDLRQYHVRGRTAKELASSLEAAVARGDLRSGAPLPPIRRMADELDLSPTTVAAALARLRARGVIVTRPRSGSHVSWKPPIKSAPMFPVPEGVRDLASGNPDAKLLPRLEPALRRLRPRARLYGAEPALPELLALAASEFEGAGIPGKHIAVVSGALDGIERTLAVHTVAGDLVAVEDPGYPGVFDLCRALGLGLRPVAVDERGMLPQDLAAALAEGAKAVVITPRGHNPTGATLDEARARALRLQLREAPDILVIEDDHLGPVAGARRLSLVAGRGRWAAARSVAKSLGPDVRLALLAGDERTIEQVEGRQMLGPQWVSHLLQGLVVALWSDDTVRGHLEAAAETYRERRESFLHRLSRYGIEASAPAGLNVWLPVGDEAGVARELLERGWAVAVGAPFRLRTTSAIRVTISTLDAKDAERLARDIAEALRPVRRTRAA